MRRGPRAVRSAARGRSTDDWSRFWHLTYNIARNEFKLRFFGSALGYLWQLMRPLLLFGVLYVFFTKIAHVNNDSRPGAETSTARSCSARSCCSPSSREATSGAVRSVVDRENLVRKIQFPRLVIPLSVVLLAMFNLGLNLDRRARLRARRRRPPMLSWLELPLIVAMLAVLATGIAMLLSALFVYFRDIQPIWDVLSQILFYASPVIISGRDRASKSSAPRCCTSTCSTRWRSSSSSSATR